MTDQEIKTLHNLAHNLFEQLDTIDVILQYEDCREEGDLESIPDRFKAVAVAAARASHGTVVVDLKKFEEAMKAEFDKLWEACKTADKPKRAYARAWFFNDGTVFAQEWIEQQAGEE